MKYKDYVLNKNTIIAGHIRTIDLCWRVYEGFSSIESLYRAVMELRQKEDQFAIIRFDNMYYAVSLENTTKQIVIAKDYIWYRTCGYNLKKFKKKPNMLIPYKIENARISRRWTEAMIEVMSSFENDFECILPERQFGNSNTYFRIACQVLFGCALYKTLLTLDHLHAVDDFFVNRPSTWKNEYEKRNIEKLNPFSEYVVYKNGRCDWNL